MSKKRFVEFYLSAMLKAATNGRVTRVKVASYIPALAEVNPKQLGVALYDLDDGEIGEAGQSEVRFAIESISKVITLMLAIKKMGIQEVFKHVGSRQTGFAFNSILNMEIEKAKYPLNPFINAGAIATTSMVVSKTGEGAFEEILSFARDICNDPNLYLDQIIYHSERRTGNLDRSLAYYMESKNMMLGDVVTSFDTYFKQCSMIYYKWRFNDSDMSRFGVKVGFGFYF